MDLQANNEPLKSIKDIHAIGTETQKKRWIGGVRFFLAQEMLQNCTLGILVETVVLLAAICQIWQNSDP